MNQTWNQRYAEKEFAYGVLPNEFLSEQLAKIAPGSILFPCEGEGRNAVYAAKLGWNATAFDFSETGCEKANLLAKQNNVTINYKVGDALEMAFEPESFDVIALVYAHFPESIRKQIHRKILSWLKPNGIIILEAFNPSQLGNPSGGPKDITMLYSKEMMENDFDILNIQHLSEEIIILNEGKYHQGKANVIRFKGKKNNCVTKVTKQ